MGSTYVRKNPDDRENEFTDLSKVELIESMPYGINFNISVYQVSCGAEFTAILTTEGEVWTFGANSKG